MAYFIIYPESVELRQLSSQLIDGELDYSIEEYGLLEKSKKCKFSMHSRSCGTAMPAIRVQDGTLANTFYDAFWRSFYAYIQNILKVNIFDEGGFTGLGSEDGYRKIYIKDVYFDVHRKMFDSNACGVQHT